jgi:O-antigen ligase
MQQIPTFGRVILHIGLAWFAITLPFQIKWLPTALGMMLAGLGWFLLWPGLRKNIPFRFSSLLLLPMAFYLLYAIGMLYADNTKKSVQILSMSIPLLAIPLIFFARHAQNIAPHLLRLFFIFSLLSAVVTLGYLGKMIWLDTENISYRQFSPFNHIPSHYLAMYFSFAGGYWMLSHIRTSSLTKHLFPGLLLLATSLLMNARIQILIVCVLLIWWLISYVRQSVHSIRQKSMAAMLMVLAFALVFAFPENQRRLIETKDEFRNLANIDYSKQKNHRFYLWTYAAEVIQDYCWLGTGTGDANDHLVAAYQKSDAQFWDGEKLYYMRQRGYNYHNQFLQSWAQNGIFALLLLVAMLVVMWRKKHASGKVFTVVAGMSMLTESILERQAGVFFFAFVFCVLLFIKTPEERGEGLEVKD